MHVLYVHKNFPAQFGHIAVELINRHGFRCSFATERASSQMGPIEPILYKPRGGATQATHRASRMFENATWESHAVFEALKRRPDIRPDVIVGHSGFGSTLFLRELYSAPIINFCEWFYRWDGGDAEFMRQSPSQSEGTRLTGRCRNATLLADLDAGTLCYSPTHWQRSQIPNEYQHKLETIFDGIDTRFWRPLTRRELGLRQIAGNVLPTRKRVVTYVSRGFESIRGFDVFMQAAQRICERRSDVVFLCIGSDRVCYGGDLKQIKEKSFREHVLKSRKFDVDRFIFTGQIPPSELLRALNFSDLHIYLTVPFILSWSLMDALACGCVVLASDTAPLREVIDNGRNGLLAPYCDVERMVELALGVLDDPLAYRRQLGQQGIATTQERYDLDVVLPQMIRLYERAIRGDVSSPKECDRGARPSIPQATDAWVGLDGLRRAHPWPESSVGHCESSGCGFEVSCRDGIGVSPVEMAAIRRMIPPSAKVILEIGAWTGETKQFFAENSQATILAVDAWHGGKFREPEHPDWKGALPWVWESFVRRVAPFRDRVIPMRQRHDDAVREVAACGLVPDMIFFDPDYNSLLVRQTLQAIAKCFPATVTIGHDWLWHGLAREVSLVACATQRNLVACGNLWRLERVARRTVECAAPSSNGQGRLAITDGAGAPVAGRSSDVRPAGVLKALVTIPHYFRPNSSRLYGSGIETRERRTSAIQQCLSSLVENLGGESYTANLARPETLSANAATRARLHVVICTSGDDHLLDDVHLLPGPWERREVAGDARFLGYACHEVLRERLGDFDCYAYLEDDLIVSDPWIFAKLAWFRDLAGDGCLLQPNRYELVSGRGFQPAVERAGVDRGVGQASRSLETCPTLKAYIDGDLPPEKTARYQDISQEPLLTGEYLGGRLIFRRTLNPHAGCFFLNFEQMRAWSERPYFLDRDPSFYSPLEGAATVGVMRTFRVYKPARENANFFEIRHLSDSCTRKLAARDQAVLSHRAH